MKLASALIVLCAAGTAAAFDIGLTPTDPSRDRARAVAELVVGAAPAGFAPLMPPACGLDVWSATFDGAFTNDPRTTAISFQSNLVIGADRLEAGLFLGTGSPDSAEPPNGATNTGQALAQSREDALAEVVSGISWSYDAQRLTIEFTALPGTNSLKFRWAFGTEEYAEYVGSQYNDAFGVFLFREGETGPQGGQFWQAAPGFRDLADVGSTYFLTPDQEAWLRAHQIAFDASGAPITVNGPFFSGQNVVVPPANNLEYDGATKILETIAPLTQGVRYTLYIVIADTNDQIYDSGVFIASLGGQTTIVSDTTTSIGPGAGGGGTSGGTSGGSTGGTSGGASTTTGGGAGSGSGTGTGTGTTGTSTGGVVNPPVGGSGSGSGTGTVSTSTRSSGGCAATSQGGAGGVLPMAALLALLAARRRRVA